MLGSMLGSPDLEKLPIPSSEMRVIVLGGIDNKNRSRETPPNKNKKPDHMLQQIQGTGYTRNPQSKTLNPKPVIFIACILLS